jgi:hypothetical protein
MMHYWVGVGAAFTAGLGIGAGLWAVLREEKLKAEYKEQTAAFMRAMQAARSNVEIHVDTDGYQDILDKTRASTEELAEKLAGDNRGVVVPEEGIKIGDIEGFTPDSNNPYHEAVDEPAASWTYLEEEDYHDDDGRYKGQITLLPGDDGKPVFVENDIEIADWEQKVGPSILRDFYTMVAPNTHPAVLYVRNNLTESDYEVIREIP